MKLLLLLLIIPTLWSCSEQGTGETASSEKTTVGDPLESPSTPPETTPPVVEPPVTLPPVTPPTPPVANPPVNPPANPPVVNPVPPVVTPPVPPVVTPPVVTPTPPVVTPTPPVVTPTPPVVTPPLVCAPGLVKVTRPTRVLFLVDASGSNLNGPYEYPLQPTDPFKLFRLKVMNDFVTTNSSKGHVTWNLSVFNDSKAQSMMSPLLTTPFGSVSDFNTAVKTFSKRYDYGRTPYRPALELAQQYIEKDILTAPKETAYLIAFMTDGYPTDYCQNGISEFLCPGKILEHEIDADVRRIVRMNPRNIKFSTVYYGKPDGDSASRLRRMADKGFGEFVDANVTSNIDLNDFMLIEQEVCVPPGQSK